MSRAQGPGLFFQNENLNIHNEGGPVLKKTSSSISKNSQKNVGGNRRALTDLSNSGLVHKNQNLDFWKEGASSQKKTSDSISKTSQKKVGGNRKALKDLSNSISVHLDDTKKENLSRGESRVESKRFLHNPHQCSAARKAEMDRNIRGAFLLAHGLEPDKSPLRKEAKLVSYSSPSKCLELEPIPELSISTESDLCSSQIQLDSPSPTVSLYDLPELKKSMSRAREAELTFQNHNSLHHNVTDHNVLEEGFLHDHDKCTEVHKAQTDRDLYNRVLLEHGLTDSEMLFEENETLVTYNSPPRYMNCEEIPELSVSTMVDLCYSPNRTDSPSFCPSWYELPDLLLSVQD